MKFLIQIHRSVRRLVVGVVSQEGVAGDISGASLRHPQHSQHRPLETHAHQTQQVSQVLTSHSHSRRNTAMTSNSTVSALDEFLSVILFLW